MMSVGFNDPVRQWFRVVGLLLLFSIPSAAAEEPTAEDAVDEIPLSQSVPRVVDVVSDLPGRPNEAGLGDRFTVTVENLATVLKEANSCQQIVLFLGGMPVPDLPPERCDPDNGHIGFFLERRGQSQRTWSALLGSPTRFKLPVRLTVGSSRDRSYPTLIQPGGQEFRLIVIRKVEFFTFLATLASTLTLMVMLSRRTALLRRPGTASISERPFSIGRTQLAFWSILVAEAYFFVWLISGNLDSITESVLALVGMGSATALGGSLIDTDPGQPQEVATDQVSRGFLTDILSDSGGVSIQRFQMLAWTLALGLIFCVSVYKTLQMPEFNATLLALMGISSGTYLAFKFPEKRTAAVAQRITKLEEPDSRT